MPGVDRDHERLAVARVHDHVMDDVADEHTIGKLPLPARLIAAQNERAFARADQQ